MPIPITVVPDPSTAATERERASADPRVIPSERTIITLTLAPSRAILSAAWIRLNSSTLAAFSNNEIGGAVWGSLRASFDAFFGSAAV